MAKQVERVGEVTAPSGVVLVIDTGLLPFWSHDRTPVMHEWLANPETVAAANSQVDFRIDGPDAERAGRAFNRQFNPFYLFDIPGHGIRTIQRLFRACAKKNGLDARLVRLKERIDHRRRVDLIRAVNPAGGEVQYQGMWSVAVAGLPADRPLEVVGERMPAGPHAGRWRYVALVCRRRGAVARSEQVGMVLVEHARLMFADVDALGAWQHDEPLDGKADFVFWGRDAAQAAKAVQAPALGDNDFGWVDLPVAEAIRHARRVEQLCEQRDWAMARDFRPHSHHYQAMAQVRATETESGTVEVGGARMCVFMTSWGDGLYPVIRDLDEEGRLVRVRIDLGNDETVRRMEAVSERYFGTLAQLALVTRRVMDDGRPVGYLYREAPHNEHDSGWRIFAGNESEAYLDDPDNTAIVPLRELIDRDRALQEVFRTPAPCAFERRRAGAEFRRIEPGKDR